MSALVSNVDGCVMMGQVKVSVSAGPCLSFPVYGCLQDFLSVSIFVYTRQVSSGFIFRFLLKLQNLLLEDLHFLVFFSVSTDSVSSG